MKPRVITSDGLVLAWWTDEFQEAINNHPEVKKIHDSITESFEEYEDAFGVVPSTIVVPKHCDILSERQEPKPTKLEKWQRSGKRRMPKQR